MDERRRDGKADDCARDCERSQGERSGPEKLGQPKQARIDHVIAVMSGKGGVGKSLVSALLAITLTKNGYRVGVLDADITGPSIPKLFGVKGVPEMLPSGIVPPSTSTGIKIMSINLLLPNEDDPVIWRGPLIATAVKQFWTDVIWGNLDYLIVDLPPGTGDAPLTVLQSLPLDGLIIVSSPQELAQMVVRKAIKMAQMLDVPLLGLVENMSYITCPHCGEEIHPFGRSRAEEVANEVGVRLLGVIPMDPQLSLLGDRGEIEQYEAESLKLVPLIPEEVRQRVAE